MKKIFITATLFLLSAQFAAATNYLVSGAGTSAVNGTYVQQSGLVNGYNYYKNGSFYLYNFLGGGTLFWIIGTNTSGATGEYYYGNADQFGVPSDPTRVTYNTIVSPAAAPYPTVTISPYTIGATGGDYSTLKAAFDAINAGSITGAVTLQIIDNTTETASAVLNASGSGSASYTSVKIYPTVSGKTISGSIAGALIDLNGADNVTIDGRLNRSGAINMTISNSSTSSTSGTSTIRFIYDASSDSVKYCTIKGSETNTSGGIIYFSNGTISGNNSNIIDHNDITCAADANRPISAIFSAGWSGTVLNSSNSITNNNIYNFLNKGNSSYGIKLGSYNSAWTISGNSFYETATFAPTAAADYNVIYIDNTGVNYSIANNNIGGSAASCSGTWVKNNAYANTFAAINIVSAGTSTASNIQGNKIANFTYSNPGAPYWYGIWIQAGDVNVGTTSGNIIGAATGTGSIIITDAGSAVGMFGICVTSTGIVNIQYNTIGSVTTITSSTMNSNIYGIYKSYTAGTTTISNNTIGSNTTPNSINASSQSTDINYPQIVCGIFNLGNGTVSISGNAIANMTNGATNDASGTSIQGIYTQEGTNTISNNTIHDLTSASSNSNFYNPTVRGICFNNTGSVAAQTITGNKIYNLSNTCASYSGIVAGLWYNGSTTASAVSGNFIRDLFVTGASSTSASIMGVFIFAGATTYSNNIISVGGNTKTTVYGIYENGAASNNNNLYFNSVYLSGTLASGVANKSYCLFSCATTNVRNFRNNIFYNARSTVSGSNLHYAAYFQYSISTNLTLDYNDYYVSGTGGTLGYYANANVAAKPLITGLDANSLNTNPLFADAGGLTAPCYNTIASLAAVAGTGITTDYNSRTRSVTTPTIGAFEKKLLYVKSNASGLNNGTNWTNAYTDLQSALTAMNSGGGMIWVASGTYKPGSGSSSRTSTFTLPNGIVIFGGFAGTESGIPERNIASNVSIISGNIGIAEDSTDNTYHVVTLSSGGTATLDGCTITGGYSTDNGGAVYLYSGTLTMKNCIIKNNYTQTRGNVYTEGNAAGLFLTNCLFINNVSGYYGGALHINGGSPTIINCTFSSNSAVFSAGAIFVGSPTSINNSIIWGNTAGSSSYQIDASSTLTLNNSCYSALSGDMGGTSTKISCITTNPQFVGSGNYDLANNSPCINTGSNTYNSESFDIRGKNYTRNNGTIDMGAYEYNANPLPVELTSFTAEVAEKSVELKWRTATEVNNYGFEVERREVSDRHLEADGHLAWTKIGFVEGNGTTNAPKSYSFTDKSANRKTSYRLKQIDRDGKFEYSQTVEVSVETTPKEFALEQNYPNPFNPTTAIGYQLSANSFTTLKIYDAIGREVATLVNEVKDAGYYSAQFDGMKLSSGIYFAKLTSDRKTQMKKLLLLK